MALKILTPGHKPRNPHHTVRFTGDDLPRYKSIISSMGRVKTTARKRGYQYTEDSMKRAIELQKAGMSLRQARSSAQESPESSLFSSYTGPQSLPGFDSGAPSPDNGHYQPAAARFRLNEQRIKLLTSINQIVQQRAELEHNRVTLSNLLEELKRKLKRRIEECYTEKKEKIKALKQANAKLEKEKFGVTTEIEHLKRHLEKEEAHHVQHARTAVAQAIQGMAKQAPVEHIFTPCSISDLPTIVSRNVARNAPSKVADNKLAAARLMRDIAELRHRVAQVEARLANELKRKRQAELDIVRVRRELSANKSCVASLRAPPVPFAKHCAKFR